MTDPFNTELHRAEIDAHKKNRLANLQVVIAMGRLTREICVEAWIEQIGDAEIYREVWNQLGESE